MDNATLNAIVLFGGGIVIALIAYYFIKKSERKHKHNSKVSGLET